jgi:hypothetical protein
LKDKQHIVTNKQPLRIIAIVLLIALFGFAYYYFVAKPVDITTLPTETRTNTDVGISFSYPAGDDGLTLVEPPRDTTPGLKAAYLLMPTKEYDDFIKSTEAREAPATIGVFVYALDTATSTASSGERIDRITRLQNWAMDNNVLTSFSQAKNTPDVIEVDGLKALHYQADGLYQQNIYLASYKNQVYMFVSQYNEEADITRTAFDSFIQSIIFD